MSFELNFSLLKGPMLGLNWINEEHRDWVCLEPHKTISGFLKLAQSLSFWRGECVLPLETKDMKLELQVLDLFNGDVSYQILDFGSNRQNTKKFTRMEYGRIGALEFQECIYAATTDLLTAMGTKAYSELFKTAFNIVDYKKLAKILSRPNQLSEVGIGELEEVMEDETSTSLEMVWESGEDDEENFLSPEAEDKEPIPRSEFAILGQLIQRQKNRKK